MDRPLTTQEHSALLALERWLGYCVACGKPLNNDCLGHGTWPKWEPNA